MRAGTLLGVVLVVAGLGSEIVVASDHDHPTRTGRQWAVVYLTQPTLIGSTIVQGPVLFTHDAAKMARGEPCTSVRLIKPGTGPIEEIASFHCIPRPGNKTTHFTLTTHPNTRDGYGCVLSAYQFAGDAETHGVSATAEGH
jgi:hypothetical protein